MQYIKIIKYYMSQPSWAAWIEIPPFLNLGSLSRCRSPLGLRGLKSYAVHQDYQVLHVAALLGCVDLNMATVPPKSPLMVAAHWGCVDLNAVLVHGVGQNCGRSPFGLRGFKFNVFGKMIKLIGRSPLGLRGFK